MSEVIINLPEINLDYKHLEQACYDINDLPEKYFREITDEFTPDGRLSQWNKIRNCWRIRKNFNSFNFDDFKEPWYIGQHEKGNCAVIVLEPNGIDSSVLSEQLQKLVLPFNNVYNENVWFKVTNSFNGTFPGRTEIYKDYEECGILGQQVRYKTKKYPRFSKQSLTILCCFDYRSVNVEKFALLVATELQQVSMLLVPNITEKKIYMSDALRLELLINES